MKCIGIIITCLLFTVLSYSQSGTISGKITDSSGKKVLPLTTITVFKAKDTVIVTYRLSNEKGEFTVPGLPYDVPLRLMATYSGYEAYRKDFTLSAAQPTFNFGSVKMTNTSKQLDEVIVTAERPPVVIRKDTIEFNASAFKTLPTALLEDLLKKMPGMQIDENGNLTYNGRTANRILVDGKRFFGDDPKMATRNLPSNMVDKIQVTDDKDQIAQNNDGDMSNIGVVVNVTLKKAIKKATFGKLYAGGGTDSRYEAGGIINTFRDTLQMSILAFSNNINRTGFSIQDVTSLGGFNRSGYNSMSIYSSSSGREGFAINGISFGGMGNGITRSTGAGFNLNHSPSKNFSFYLQYFYGGSHSIYESVNNTQRFFGDTTLLSQSTGSSITNTDANTVTTGINWRKDSLTNINFSGGLTYNSNRVNGNSGGGTQNNKLGNVSNSNGTSTTLGSSDAVNYNFSLTHRYAGKKNRNLSVYHYFNYTKNPVDNINESINNYLYPSINTLLVAQLRTTNSPNTRANVNLNYSDQLSSKLTLRVSERLDYNNTAQLVGIYAKHAATGFYDSLNTFLSNDLRREQTSWTNLLTLTYRINKVNVNLGGNYLQQWIENRYAKGANSNQHYADLLFNGGFNWKRISFSVTQNVSAPSISYLNPVTDNSNPFYIVNGNPDLKPSRQTSVNMNGNIVNVKANVTYNFFGGYTKENDAVIQSLVVNSTGVQITTPVNVNDVNRYNLYFRVNKQFKKNPKFLFSIDAGMSGNVNNTPMLFNNEMSRTSSYGFTPSLRFNMNWHDVVEFNPSANINFRKNTYSSKSFNTTDYTGQGLQGEFIVRLPRKFVWETNMAYTYISNLAPGLPKTNLYWNAALTLLMFKEDKGQLKLAVYDILNRNTNVYRYISGNVITDSRSNVLQRYFMLTYSYNIRTLGTQKQKVGGKQSMFFF